MGNRPRAFQRAIDGLRTLPLSPCGVFLLMGWVGTHLPKFNRSSQARQRTSRFVVWRGAGRSARHHGLNDVTWRALSAANIPAAKEPSGLLRSDGKRPDGLTLIPWKNGRCVTWDVTVWQTHWPSLICQWRRGRLAGQQRRQLRERHWSTFSSLRPTHSFQSP